MPHLKFFFLTILFFTLSGRLLAQYAFIEGLVRSEKGLPVVNAHVSVEGTTMGTVTDSLGLFRLLSRAGESNLLISHMGYESYRLQVRVSPEQILKVEITLSIAVALLPDVVVREAPPLPGGLIRLDPRNIERLAGPVSGVERLLKTLPGVFSTQELSFQYSVRGGNFDENLVYVNGIEIHRPFLARSGQHEGLSFLNSNLVSSIQFSAGGFDARFGDKMSSALEIEYRKPESFAGSFSLSLLEGSLHLEGISKNRRTTYLLGLRHKSNQYLLGTLDTEGDYQPSFSDFQGLITHKLTDRLEISLLANYNRNHFLFQPEVQNTRFGTATDVRQLTVYFDGQEVNRFETTMGALSANFRPNPNINLRVIVSLFQSNESETFDVLGQYWLHRVQTDFGRDDFGQPVGEPLGVGTFLRHARNNLNVLVWNAENQGMWMLNRHTIRWGFRYRQETIFDRLNEWTMIDSSGFSLPRQPSNLILLQDTLFARLNMQSERFSGFLQHAWEAENRLGRFFFTAGLRMHHWSFNEQTVISPRGTVILRPFALPRWSFRASAGFYHQPPFYRELRDFRGQLNRNIKAQESIHFVLGSEYQFIAWGRPFKYTTELYYKHLNHLIPYRLDNVRIRYFADNMARGFATGLDLKLHGEFVPGIESWASLSVMKTAEKIYLNQNDNQNALQEPVTFIPRPTDQRFNFSLFFQDYLPRNPAYKVHLAFIYGSGLPFGPPLPEHHRNTLRMPPYRRVDIGFSKVLIGEQSNLPEQSLFRHFSSLWVTAEVFNLLQINNTISYQWIRDVENRLFAVPNYLTRRLINLKLVARF
ncbi:MAG TPA: TonB-dependent receptor [Bacteroidales bacterium]|nr:TonB-dependent receptor [Bacteroidales bacterium]